jgi:pyruvyltransferase
MIDLYWWNQDANFGDQLSPRVCGALSGQDVRFAEPGRDCDLVAIGSILQHVHGERFCGAVWGTGLVSDEREVPDLSNARVFAVRGRLTAQRIGAHDVALGDPGLLCNRFARPRPKRFRLGVIPHYVDRDDETVRRVVASSASFTWIDVTAGVAHVMDRVAECDVVASSCLHGLVAADALGIPNAWIELSDKVIGGRFKFHDYYSVFGIEKPEPRTLATLDDAERILASVADYDRPGLEAIRTELVRAFPMRRHSLHPWWTRRRLGKLARRSRAAAGRRLRRVRRSLQPRGRR